ncbi:MAG: DUF4837 family protein [Flavobacteriales bacterium]|nr:DUF4837 family protein [Flavobacteriales bacterium]
MMRLLFISILSVILLVGCGEASRQDTLPRNSGNTGEVVVVAPSQVWTTSYRDAIGKAMNVIMYGLPQDELLLKRVELKEQGFNDMFRTHRNILKIEVHPKQKTAVQVRRDVYARQQLFIVINLQNLEELSGVLDSRMGQILALFHEAEIDRLISRNKDFGKEDMKDKIREITGLELVVQDKFQVAVEKDGFLWLRLDQTKPLGGYQHTISQGLMIYSRPYTDTADFSDSSLLAWKSSVNEMYVSGPKNSHMSISDRFLQPKSNLITFQGLTAKEIRGLWRMEGYFMGGPFYSLVFYNPANGLQYMVEGYAYAPQFDKAPLIREIEAIAKSATPMSVQVEKTGK